ncbi:MAG: hypothetical protein KGL39_12210 [Patescibacteria group bacterium]|nr:hypothetical protein [Patescibacteria group bacterium]
MPLRKLYQHELAQDRPMELRLLNAAVRELLFKAETLLVVTSEDRQFLKELRFQLNGEDA